MKSMDLYRAFGGIDDALLEQSEALGEASFKDVRTGNRLHGAGQWIRRHGSLVALLAVCVAVGSFLTFGGGIRMGGSSKSAAAPSTPASAPALASAPAAPAPSAASAESVPAEENNMLTAESPAATAGNYASDSAAPEEPETSSGSKQADQFAYSGNNNESLDAGVIESLEYGGRHYTAVYDEVYKIGEALGEEYTGYPLYSVEGYNTEEMIALYDEAGNIAAFFRAE
ncbi:MAG: hypothetical protein IKR93_03760 [Firmicutes bacterium]|nr:hypothetical protein [Bacillota bacterium]